MAERFEFIAGLCDLRVRCSSMLLWLAAGFEGLFPFRHDCDFLQCFAVPPFTAKILCALCMFLVFASVALCCECLFRLVGRRMMSFDRRGCMWKDVVGLP